MFGIVFSAWIFFIISLWIPLSRAHAIIHDLILILLSILIRSIRIKKKSKTIQILNLGTYIFGVILPSFLVGYLVWDGLLNEGFYTHGASYGDFPFHMNIISSFVHGCNKNRKYLFDIVSPFYSHQKLAYPFIPNYYAAVLMESFKLSIHDAAVLPSIPVIVSLYVIFVDLIFAFSNSQMAAVIGVYLFTFNGGLGFQSVFNEQRRKYWLTDYVRYWGKDMQEFWLQATSHILLPQRASLYSLPIAWSILLILISCNNNRSIKEFIAAGLLVAELPQVHPHSIIALAQWGGVFAIITFPYRKPAKVKIFINKYLALGIVAIIFGAFQCVTYTGRTNKNKFMKIQPVNRGEYQKNILVLWWRALGPFIVMSFIHAPIIFNKYQFQCYIPSLVVFLIGNIIVYQPWALDNTKIWNATFIPIATSAVALFLSKLLLHGNVGKIISLCLIFFCTFSGILCVRSTFKCRSIEWDIYKAPYEIANFVINKTPPDSIWMTDNQHDNPIVTLGGRQVFVGYIGWLMNHGLDYNERRAVMNRLCKDPENTTEIDMYNITYVGLRYSNLEYKFKPPKNTKKWEHVYSSVVFDVWHRTNVY